MTVRDRRLASDYEKLQAVVNNSGDSLVIESVTGKPPSDYVIGYRCKGIEGLHRGTPVFSDYHRVQIHLPAAYPSAAGRPVAQLLTPMYHPHVFSNNVVCLGAMTINEYLDALVMRIGAIIQYDPQYFDFNSPANRDAADWAKRNMRLFPVGSCTFRAPTRTAARVVWNDL